MFGCDDWREAIPMRGDERKSFLLSLFQRQLARNDSVEHTYAFQLRTQDGMDYRLVFALGHRKGLEIAKEAMWKVDPLQGTSYVATTHTGQEVLFGMDEVDTAPLLADLRARFKHEWFTLEEAEDFTLFDTPYRIGHLRQRTLAPARRAGLLETDPSEASTFTKVARLRFW